MDTISNNPTQINSVRTVTSLNYIKRTYNLPQDDSKSFEKEISSDEKSLIVGEKQNNSSNAASFDYQFQNNVPVSVLLTTNQTYNEINRPLATPENSPAKTESEISNYTIEDSSGKNQKAGLGYYLVDTHIATTSGKKASQKLSSPLKDRLNKIYNLNFSIDPGTIVNVTCF